MLYSIFPCGMQYFREVNASFSKIAGSFFFRAVTYTVFDMYSPETVFIFFEPGFRILSCCYCPVNIHLEVNKRRICICHHHVLGELSLYWKKRVIMIVVAKP